MTYIKAIVVVKEELELSRPVASGATKNAKGNGSRRADETRSGSDGNETRDGTRAETDNGPLALKTPILEIDGLVRARDRPKLLLTQSIQVRPPTEAARLVTMHAWTARKLAPRADPPLNPNHPNQRRTVPRTT